MSLAALPAPLPRLPGEATPGKPVGEAQSARHVTRRKPEPPPDRPASPPAPPSCPGRPLSHQAARPGPARACLPFKPRLPPPPGAGRRRPPSWSSRGTASSLSQPHVHHPLLLQAWRQRRRDTWCARSRWCHWRRTAPTGAALHRGPLAAAAPPAAVAATWARCLAWCSTWRTWARAASTRLQSLSTRAAWRR